MSITIVCVVFSEFCNKNEESTARLLFVYCISKFLKIPRLAHLMDAQCKNQGGGVIFEVGSAQAFSFGGSLPNYREPIFVYIISSSI
jgi:hypothetical protein